MGGLRSCAADGQWSVASGREGCAPAQPMVSVQWSVASVNIFIDNITVDDSGFDSTAISYIVAALNAQFDDDVVFTAELSETDEYSTIYIGITSAFDAYGDFLGLAETIDSGNQIHDDNAFVFLNSTVSVELVTSVIAHETEHLVNGLEHDVDGLEK